jgi:hypothetical protein
VARSATDRQKFLLLEAALQRLYFQRQDWIVRNSFIRSFSDAAVVGEEERRLGCFEVRAS